MSRKLILLNVVLAALLVWGGMQWRRQYLDTKAREAAALHRAPKPAPDPQFVPLPGDPAVMATAYKDVAQKMLFHPSRDPNLPVEEKPAPPPPPPMPPLPKYHGSMNLGGGPTALLSVANDPVSREVKPGETIGQFTLVDVNTQDITFEWNGQQVRKTLNELTDRSPAASNSGPTPPSASGAPVAPPEPVIKSALGPQGPANQFGTKACNPNDNMPDGSVVDGFRKVSFTTPFGPGCRWDPVGK